MYSLHSTMFLLIPDGKKRQLPYANVSLHSTMFLLIPGSVGQFATGNFSLHSTMFLLILVDLVGSVA